MPELPAVEYSRQLLENNVVGHCIKSINYVEDEIIFEGKTGQEISKFLQGRKVITAGRHGKYLWLELDLKKCLLMHFGMTGFIEIKGKDRLHYRSAPESNEPRKISQLWPPRFWKIDLLMDNGLEVAFGDARRLGRIKLLEGNPKDIPPVSKLGFDPILNMPVFNENFINLVTKRSMPLKTLLLDQTFSAGVGNWMADDILLRAGLHPSTMGSDLNDSEIKSLHEAIKYISVESCKVNADGSLFPKDWLFHCRWPKDRRKGTPSILGHSVQFVSIGGRTTAFVPALQKKKSTKEKRTSSTEESNQSDQDGTRKKSKK